MQRSKKIASVLICYGQHFAGGKQPALYVDAGKDRRSCALFPCGKPDMEIRRGKLPGGTGREGEAVRPLPGVGQGHKKPL